MEFFTGALVGGLIYDVVKLGGSSSYLDIIKVALKSYSLTEEEKLLLAQDLSSATEEDKSTKENLENYFETKAENTKEIVNKYKIGTQNNQTNNSGRNTITGERSTYIENQTVYKTSEPKEESKKH